MVLPLLFSIGLPALAGTGALGATLGAMSVPALAGIGAGLGSFVQTGDIGKGIQTGMASFLGGKVLGGLSGSTSTNAINAAQGAEAAVKPGFIQSLTAPGTPATQVVAGDPSNLATKFLGTETANAPMPFGTTPGSTKGGTFTAAQQGFTPGLIGQSMTDMQLMQQGYKNRAADDENMETKPPMPNPMIRTFNPNPYAGGFGEANYFSYQRPPRPDGSTPRYPYPYADGGIVSLAEGGEVEADEMMEEAGMNEKDLISEAILAIKGMKGDEETKLILGTFLAKYGKEQYLELVESVQSGEYDDTVSRFAAGEKGMVKGPGDGSGKDDMVPATLDGQQDVLLTEDEFVLRQPTTKAIEKAFGGGFLDKINEAEEDAPEMLRRMVG